MTRAFGILFLISVLSGFSSHALAAIVPGETSFTTLIHQFARAQATRTPWVGYWWPYNTGGISASQFEQGSSPSQKYDQAYRAHLHSRGVDLSRFEGITPWEDEHHGAATAGSEPWQGHDLGWAAASILLPEPQKPVAVGDTRFEVSDLKALLAEYATDVEGVTYGKRVDTARDQRSSKYHDVSPNQFFLALTNLLGKEGKALLIDRHAGIQTLHVPVVAYALNYPMPTDYLGPHYQYRGVHRLRMTARVWWASNNVAPNSRTPVFDLAAMYDRFDDQFFPGTKYEFELWLDAPVVFDQFGKVVSAGRVTQIEYGQTVMGGAWVLPANAPADPALRDLSHPDYIMVPTSISLTNKKRNPRWDSVWFVEKFVKAD